MLARSFLSHASSHMRMEEKKVLVENKEVCLHILSRTNMVHETWRKKEATGKEMRCDVMQRHQTERERGAQEQKMKEIWNTERKRN